MSVITKDFWISSRADGLMLSGLMVGPAGRCWGVLQIVHGMSEKKECYIPFMEQMAEEGWLCVVYDQRGHGQSVKKKEELGYLYKGGYKALIEDCEQVRAYVEEGLNQELPYVMLGHSMGALIVRCYMQKYDENIDKVILTGTPSKPKMFKAELAFAKAMKTIRNEKKHSDFMNKAVFGKMVKKYVHEGSINSWMCASQEAVRVYDETENCGFAFTVNGYYNLAMLMNQANDKKAYAVENPELPILMISGRDDMLHRGPRNFGKTVHFIKRLGYINTKAGLYAGMRHGILFEKNKQRVYNDIRDFLEN